MGSAHTDALDALLSSNTRPNAAAWKLALSRIASEAHTRLASSSNSGEFFLAAISSLARIKGSAYADIRLNCLWDCAQYFYFNGDPHKAISGAHALRDLAGLAGNKAWLRKSTMMIAILHADRGDVAEALLIYAQALEQARTQNDAEGEVSVLVNTGIAMNYGALYAEAIPCFRRAFSLASAAGLQDYLPRILINQAQSHYNLDQVSDGFKAAESALQSTKNPVDVVTSVSAITRELTYVQLAIEVGKLESARMHAKNCAAHAQRWGSPRGKLLSNVASGICEVYGGDVNKGFDLLEGALIGTGAEIDSVRSDILTALVKAYEAASQPERALHFLKMLLHHKRDTRSKSLASLIAFPLDVTGMTSGANHIDLRAYELKEAQLRASVAERELVTSRIEMLERLAIAADLKEESSGQHGYRVGKLSALFGELLGMTPDQHYSLDVAARLHDLGKLGVPDRILLSSMQLKDVERHFISAHTAVGAELLAKSDIPQLQMAEEIARYHHEWWNGEGYPAKLKGKRIPIHARIVALADVFDALTHGRPFSKPWPMDQAIDEIRKRKGTQFDPELTDVFLALIERLRNEHADLDEYLGRAGRNSPFLLARNKIRLMLAEERDNEKKTTVDGNETRH